MSDGLKPTQEQLYDAFGELLYAIAMVDGEVQIEEAQKIEKMLQEHPAAQEIKWSFTYEHEKKQSVEDAYKKAIDICKYYGASTEYPFLLDLVTKVAAASDGLSEEESAIIERFRTELTEHFNSKYE